MATTNFYFLQQKVEYLGHIISEEGVAVDPFKIGAMQNWPTSRNIKLLHGFLGLTGYYRKFVKNYGKISAPLTSLLEKDVFQWLDRASAAFDKLKAAMTTTPVLTLPDFNRPFIIEADTSGVRIGAILMQDGRPLAYTSKALSPSDQNMSTYDKEMLAIVRAATRWRLYLIRRYFQIKTDHKSLKYLLEQKISSPEQQKWATKLLGFDFEITYKKGKENVLADALSQLPEQVEVSTVSLPTSDFLEDIKMEWQEDSDTSKIIKKLEEAPSPMAHYNWDSKELHYKGRIVLVTNSTCIFKSRFWTKLFHMQGTKLKRSMAYHPQTDGQTKVLNRCLETAQSHPPNMTTQRELQTQPSAIIDRRIVTRRRRPTNEVLIQWANLPIEDATWENYDDLKIKFPEFMNHQPRGQG